MIMNFNQTSGRRLLKWQAVIGVVFVLLLGTLSHFLYDWTRQNPVIGLFTPVNESIWEHMKLVFFPMLFYGAGLLFFSKKNRPCIRASLCSGILFGTLLIPVLYYAYTAVLGKNIFALDLAVFVISVLSGFLLFYRLAASCRCKRCFFICGVLCVLFACFLLFTYHPLDLELFRNPETAKNTAVHPER